MMTDASDWVVFLSICAFVHLVTGHKVREFLFVGRCAIARQDEIQQDHSTNLVVTADP